MQTILIEDAINLSNRFLTKLGFKGEEINLITKNIVDAEIAQKRTHGLIRLLAFKKKNEENKLNKDLLKLNIKRESPISLYIDGGNKLGYGLIYKSLDLAVKKAKSIGICSVGIKDVGMTGYIGGYARIATENDLIFISFNSSPKGLVPYGAKKDLWGTNPLTVAIPSKTAPIILDMASTKITWGDLMIALNENKNLKHGVAIDKNGDPTIDPKEAAQGGFLPISEHKGSGLGFIVELLGGALTGSRVGYSIPGGGGTFYILINPDVFVGIDILKDTVHRAVNELKSSPKMKGFSQILFPGEKSSTLRAEAMKSGKLSVSDILLDKLHEFID